MFLCAISIFKVLRQVTERTPQFTNLEFSVLLELMILSKPVKKYQFGVNTILLKI